MNPVRCTLWAVVSYATLTVGTAWADWSMPKMFTTGKDMPAASGKKKSSKSTSSKRAPTKPTLVNSMTQAPKKLYSSTKALVTPKKKPASSGKKTSANKQPVAQNNSKPSLFKSWFVPTEPPAPRTVGEWMAQKRLDP